MQVPLLDLKSQYQSIKLEIDAAIKRVIDSQYFILGTEVEALEKEIAEYSGCEYGIGVSSGTDALLISLMAIGIKPGDEVITTPYTFFATAGSIVRLGAKPIFVDIDLRTYNIDPSRIEAVLTERTRAIIPIHLFGQMADMGPIMEISRQHNLIVIEDAAQAIGAEYKGHKAGSIGHIGCLSFFPSKNLGAFGDGGMVLTNNSELADKIKLLRGHGAMPKYYHQVVGGNFRLDALQAAVLRVKLKYLDQWTVARQLNAERYRCLFDELGLVGGNISLPSDAIHGSHIYNQFVIWSQQRDELRSYMNSCKVGNEIYYPLPLHMQSCFSALGYGEGDFLNSELAAKNSLALPIYPELTEELQAQVVSTIGNFYKEHEA